MKMLDSISKVMKMGKSTGNMLIPFIVILLVVIAFGLFWAEDEDILLRDSNAESKTSGNAGSYNVGPSGVGAFLQTPPYVQVGGIAQSGLSGQAGNTNRQQRVPGEGVWMGMEIESISPGTISELGLRKNQQGVILDSVPPGSDAERAGLRNGDIIRAINGQIVVNMADYIKATQNQKLDSAIIEVERNGSIQTIAMSPNTPIRQQPTIQTGMGGGWPGGNSGGLAYDAYTGASAKISRLINKNGVPPITMNSPLPHQYVGVCSRCHEIVQGRIPLNLLNVPGNSPAGAAYQGNNYLPSPAQQNAAHKVLVEGHWLGMELIPITPELAREYKLPAGITGLLVDEVTLESAESGLLAGDVLVSINGIPIKTLEDFELATRQVESLPSATLVAVRNGQQVSLTLRSSWTKLGVAQNEAAQPIQPGAISPHKDMGRACTDCHIIMKNGGQLQTDAGDILPTPRPITANASAPHEYRGQCNRCHLIVK